MCYMLHLIYYADLSPVDRKVMIAMMSVGLYGVWSVITSPTTIYYKIW